MDQKDLIKYGLIAIGAYLIYKYVEANGGLSAVLGTTAAAAPLPAGTTVTPAQVAAALAAAKVSPPASTSVSTPPATSTTISPVNIPITPAPPIAAVIGPVSQQMLAAATAAGEPNSLSMDGWNYYFEIVTGQPSPLDPGAVPAGVYQGAGIVDRTTLTDIGTWLAIAQNQLPSAGLSAFFGLGGPRYTPAWLM